MSSAHVDEVAYPQLRVLAELWAKGRFFHPSIILDPRAWDAAMELAIEQVLNSKTNNRLVRIVHNFLLSANDAPTQTRQFTALQAESKRPFLDASTPGVLVLDLDALWAETVTQSIDFVGIHNRITSAVASLAKANIFVLHLGDRPIADWLEPEVHRLLDGLPSSPRWPTERIVQHFGFCSQFLEGSSQFYTTFVTPYPRLHRERQTHGPKHTIVVAKAGGWVPSFVVPILESDSGWLVGPASTPLTARTVETSLTGNFTASIRVSELNVRIPRPDVIVEDECFSDEKCSKLIQKLRARLGGGRGRFECNYPSSINTLTIIQVFES